MSTLLNKDFSEKMGTYDEAIHFNIWLQTRRQSIAESPNTGFTHGLSELDMKHLMSCELAHVHKREREGEFNGRIPWIEYKRLREISRMNRHELWVEVHGETRYDGTGGGYRDRKGIAKKRYENFLA